MSQADSLIDSCEQKLSRYEWNSLKSVLYESLDTAKNRQVYEWVTNKAKTEGHAILHYISVRAMIKEHRLFLPSQFERTLVDSIMFLVRVAEDAIAARQVNGFTGAAELFSIFHNKVHRWLVPFESRVVAPPQESSLYYALGWQKSVAWPGVGEVYNAWPSVERIVHMLKDECKEMHVQSHWSWCAYCSGEWVDTITFGDIPSEIVATYSTNLPAAYQWRKRARAMLMAMLETAESWESFWSITAQAWVRVPAGEKQCK